MDLFPLVGLLVAAGTFVLVFVLPVATFLRVSRALREAERAHARVDAVARVVADLLRERRQGGDQAVAGATAGPAPASPAPASPAPEPVLAVDQPPPVAAAVPAEAPIAREVATVVGPVADAPGPVLPAPADGPPVEVESRVPEPQAVAAAGDPAGEAPPLPSPVPGPVAGAPPVEPAHARAHVSPTPTLEQRIGQRWLLYAGIAAIVLGASYIVKLAFENDWITPTMRVALSAAGGVALVAAGLRFAATGLRFFGYALSGGGFAVIYVAIYAAQHLYFLIERGTAFAAMTLATVAAAGLADRRSAQPVAMAALLGGFATPFLVGGERDAYVALFGYLTLLILGAAFLARRHRWPLVTLAAFVLTCFSFSAWAVSAYQHDRYAVVLGFLTLWLGAFLAAVQRPRRDASQAPEAQAVPREDPAEALSSGVAVIVGALGPLLYHMAALAILYRHSRDLLVYFIAATLAGILYSADGKRPWARLLIWVAVWLPMVAYLIDRTPVGARTTVLAVFGLHLMSEVRLFLRERDRLEAIDALLLHLNGLGLLAGLLALHPRWDTDAMSTTVAIVGAGYGVLALGMRGRHALAPLHYFALAAACAAGAIALRFEGAWVTAGWAVEGALVAMLGLREKRQWMRLGGWVLLVLALAHGLEQLSRPAAASTLPWINAPSLSLVLVAGLLLLVARRYAASADELPGRAELPIGGAVILAAATLLVVITEQINGMFGRFAWQQAVEAGEMAAGAADLARQVTLSIAWAAYAVALLVAGIVARYALARYLAIILFAATIGKVFFVDLAELDRLYRIVSVIGLGVLLLVASYLYQRFVSDDQH